MQITKNEVEKVNKLIEFINSSEIQSSFHIELEIHEGHAGPTVIYFYPVEA